MREKNFLKVGEFAKVCQTTKETLLHYDRKGILKPKYVAENGYRCYGLEQYFEYDLIALLKGAGCTLEEIKRNQENIDKKGYMSFIKQKIIELRKQQYLISRRISMLTRMVDIADESSATEFDKLFYQDICEEKVLYHQVEHDKMFDKKACVICYSNFLFDGLENGNTVDFPLGMVISKENCIIKKFIISYLFRSVEEKESGNIKLINSGKYACMFHHGDMESHELAFEYFINEIENNNFLICSDLFIFDNMNYLLFGVNTTFTAKYCVRVKVPF